MEPIICPETQETKYQSALHNISEERRPHRRVSAITQIYLCLTVVFLPGQVQKCAGMPCIKVTASYLQILYLSVAVQLKF
jgi:hypothetical protein